MRPCGKARPAAIPAAPGAVRRMIARLKAAAGWLVGSIAGAVWAVHILNRVQPGEYNGQPVWIYQGYDGIHIWPRRTAEDDRPLP